MPSEDLAPSARPGPAAPGAVLLCRAPADSVALVAALLPEPLLLTAAGEGWSVLVPEGRAWADGAEPVDRVATGWATALAVGTPWPVLALWWDRDRAGYTLAAGFRRPVGYVWLADGTPAGEDEAMRTFAAKLGLDPVLDVQSLDRLAEPDPASDARARLRGLLAVLSRAGVRLPAGLTPGAPTADLRTALRDRPGVRRIDRETLRESAREELHALGEGLIGPRLPSRWPSSPSPSPLSCLPPYLPSSGGPAARALALAQIALGLPLAVRGLRRRSPGWLTVGGLLLAHGTLALACELTRPRD
ncbi:hypothetical protein AB0O01_30350 [Streptomyces sp. NPDC093252]|uniref:hypothetical protein n=1 Tax=Streptomyces sp. NPDC093252 TaxID=3154980 RepID=UPI003433CE8C